MDYVVLVVVVGLLVCAGWAFLKSILRKEDPVRHLVKWIVTVLFVFGILKAAYIGPFVGLFTAIVLGTILGLMWAQSWAAIISRPFESLYDGGGQEIEERPLYSMASAKRKRGDYQAAVSEVRKQLERFPSDFEGLILLSEIQAEDLHDLENARQTIEELLQQSGHAPKNIAFAMNRLADWELALGKDPVAARRTVERIVQAFPNSEHAQFALQRIVHLDSGSFAPARQEPRRFVLEHHEGRLGLQESASGEGAPVQDPSEAARGYLNHLSLHPHDFEAREKLAAVYADDYHRLDLAADQLEFLIAAPNQPPKQVVRWLNRLADYQIRLASDTDLARRTLERIIAASPDSAAAENARSRIPFLNREVKGKQKGQVVKLGSYEQNIGLKQRKPTG